MYGDFRFWVVPGTIPMADLPCLGYPLCANYEMQYRLDVVSAYAATNGPGWYFENVTTHASVAPSELPAQGLPGLLGVRHVFDHWTGDCTGSRGECAAVMDAPKTAAAVWRDDYTTTILAIVSLIVMGTVALTVIRRVIERRRKGVPAQAGRLDSSKPVFSA